MAVILASYLSSIGWAEDLSPLWAGDCDLPHACTSPHQDDYIWVTFRSNSSMTTPVGTQYLFSFTSELVSTPIPIKGLEDYPSTTSGWLFEYNGRIILFFRGLNPGPDPTYKYITYISEWDGDTKVFKKPEPIIYSTTDELYPAVPVMYADKIHLFLTDQDSPEVIKHWSSRNYQDLTWFLPDKDLQLAGTVAGTPAVAVYQGAMHVLYGLSSRSLYLQKFDGTYWSEPVRMPAMDATVLAPPRPALTVYNGLLYCFAIFQDQRKKNAVLYSTYDGTSFSSTDIIEPLMSAGESPGDGVAAATRTYSTSQGLQTRMFVLTQSYRA